MTVFSFSFSVSVIFVFQLAYIRNTFLCTVSLGFCWHCTDFWAPVDFLFKSLLIKKRFSFFHCSFFYGSANEQRTDKGTNLALKPPLFKASVVNLGCIQTLPLRWPSPTSPLFPLDLMNSWERFSHSLSSHCCRSWTGTAGECTPFDPESCIAGIAGRSDYWGGRKEGLGWFEESDLRHRFSDWLAFKVFMII